MSRILQRATRKGHLISSGKAQPFKLGPIALACAILTLSALSYSNRALAAEAAKTPAGSGDAGSDTASQPTNMQTVVVTGQNQALTVQKKSESIESVSGAQLERNAVPDITTLIQSIAGVSLKTEGTGQTEIEMRGMTSSGGSSPTTGFYLDDIPLTPPSGAQNGKVVISPA
ncbi:MAG TPA: TonB-dependent receptor plug domain-containing protein, partial [Janthinobacterium sp.]|nr:TonB-dependent receptor plug domain-containing protein [Janthinobacterium sp.]